MVLEYLLLGPLVVFLLGYAFFQWATPKMPPNFPAGPKNVPVIGSIKEIYKLDEITPFAYTKLGAIFGPLTGIFIGGFPGLVVTGYEAVKEVLATQKFDARPDSFSIFMKPSTDKNATSTGIMCNNSESRKQLKAIVADFWKNTIKKDTIFERQVDPEIEYIISNLSCKAKDSSYNLPSGASVPDFIKSVVVRFFWSTLTGTKPDVAQSANVVHLASTFREVNKMMPLLNRQKILLYIPKFKRIWEKNVKNHTELRSLIHDAIDRPICSAADSSRTDFMAHCHRRLESDSSLSMNMKRIQLTETTNDLFGAGAENASNYISFGILYMLLYPDIQEKVQQELDLVVGSNRLPSLSDQENLHYLRAVGEEVLRVLGPAPMSLPHRTMESFKLRGYDIPKDTVATFNFHSVHMEKEFWGDPEAFRPERYLNEENQFVKSNRMFSFGSGKRACPGETFARATFFKAFSAILQNFKIGKIPGTPLPSTIPAHGVTMAPQTFDVTLQLRSSLRQIG